MSKIKDDEVRAKAGKKYSEDYKQAFFSYIDMLVDNGVEPDAIVTRENGEKLKAYYSDIFAWTNFIGRLEENGEKKHFDVSLDEQGFGVLRIEGGEREELDLHSVVELHTQEGDEVEMS